MKEVGKAIILFIFAIGIFPISLLHAGIKDGCVVERAVFELGSGVTTVAVATVNKCTNTIVKLQKQVHKSMPYQTYLNTSADKKTLPKNAIEKGIVKIQEAKKELGIDCNNISCVGIATAAMRNAKNGNIAVKQISQETKVNVHVISQKEEGWIGYHAAVIKENISDKEQKEIMMLDIGGGSYQVVYPDQDERLVYSGMIGSSIFRAMVIELVKGYSLHETHTPNPMTQHEVDEAKLLAVKAIGEPITGVEQIKGLLQNSDRKIYGIGNFLKAMAKLSGNNDDITKIKLDNINTTIKELSLKSDDYIAQHYKDFPYVNEVITNLIFVYGIMKALNVETIHIIDVNNTLGAFVLPKYWS